MEYAGPNNAGSKGWDTSQRNDIDYTPSHQTPSTNTLRFIDRNA